MRVLPETACGCRGGGRVCGTASVNGTYSKINSTLDSNTIYPGGTVVRGQTYYYAATAVHSAGQESTHSTPVGQSVP